MIVSTTVGRSTYRSGLHAARAREHSFSGSQHHVCIRRAVEQPEVCIIFLTISVRSMLSLNSHPDDTRMIRAAAAGSVAPACVGPERCVAKTDDCRAAVGGLTCALHGSSLGLHRRDCFGIPAHVAVGITTGGPGSRKPGRSLPSMLTRALRGSMTCW